MAFPWRLDDGQIEVMDDAVAAILRTKTPAQKVAAIGAMNVAARKILRAQIERRHPDWDERQVLAEVARRMSGGAT